jgi:hypothetical protein
MAIEEVDYVIEEDAAPEPETEAAEEADEDEEKVAPEAGDETAREEEAKRPSKKERQEIRAREHRALTEERTRREAAERRSEELQQQLARAVTTATERMVEVVDRSTPKPKPLIESLKEDLRERAKQVRDDDPKTTERFLDGIPEIVSKLGEEQARRIVGEELAKFQRAQPAAPTPAQTRLEARFPWLFRGDNGPAVRAIANGIARRESRDMSDETVKEKTWAEAAAKWAAQEGLEVYDNRGQTSAERSAAVARVSGSSGRNGSGGGGSRTAGAGAGGVAAVKNNPVARAAADKFYGKIKGDARYQRYFDEVVKPELDIASTRRR